MTTAEQFHYLGRDFLTEFAQVTDKLRSYTASFEARGGANQFTAAKHTGENLTDEQLAENAVLDLMASDTTEIVYLNNDLQAFLDANKKATLARLRTDY